MIRNQKAMAILYRYDIHIFWVNMYFNIMFESWKVARLFSWLLLLVVSFFSLVLRWVHTDDKFELIDQIFMVETFCRGHLPNISSSHR